MEMTVTSEDRVCRTTKAAWQDLDGETVLLLAADEKLLGLNTVAGRIWQLADGTRSVAAIARTIGSEFEGGGRELDQDTLGFVNELVARGLLEPCRE
jgi:coenzyme PQQ synthesis protein D (PqqD)